MQGNENWVEGCVAASRSPCSLMLREGSYRSDGSVVKDVWVRAD